jgi:hypothetical protein
MRRRGRLARTTLRGMLMIAGVLGAWSAYDAIADEAAYAAEAPCPRILGELLDAAATSLGSSLSCTPASPAGSTVDGVPVRVDGVGSPAAGRSKADRIRPPAGRQPPVSSRAPTGERSATERAPVRQVVDATAAAGMKVVEAAEPVTRRVVGVESPVLQAPAGAGLLAPVGAVVRPVVQPIVAALVPVLDLTHPVIGGPTAPQVPAGDPVDVPPAPAEAPPGVTTPAAIPATARPTPWAPIHPERPPSAPTGKLAAGGGPASDAAVVSHLLWPAQPAHPPGLTPTTPASTAGNGSAGGWTGNAADTSLRSWTPGPPPQGCCAAQSDELADEPRQPDTRPT